MDGELSQTVAPQALALPRKQPYNISYFGLICGVSLRLLLKHEGALKQKGPACPQISIVELRRRNMRFSWHVSRHIRRWSGSWGSRGRRGVMCGGRVELALNLGHIGCEAP